MDTLGEHPDEEAEKHGIQGVPSQDRGACDDEDQVVIRQRFRNGRFVSNFGSRGAIWSLTNHVSAEEAQSAIRVGGNAHEDRPPSRA